MTSTLRVSSPGSTPSTRATLTINAAAPASATSVSATSEATSR
jgi:hypothetical protein